VPTERAQRRRRGDAGMEPWLRNAVMIVTLTVWAVVVAAYLYAGELPDAVLLGVPGGIYLALSPLPFRRKPKPEIEGADEGESS